MTAFGFTISSTDGAARRGRVITAHGSFETPAFAATATAATIKAMLLHVGNSGRYSPVSESCRHSARGADECWDALIQLLSSSTEDLGWDALALLSEMQNVNVILFAQVRQTTIYAANTKGAVERWGQAARSGQTEQELVRQEIKSARGPHPWTDDQCTTNTLLLPCRVREGWPFVCLYHRTGVCWSISRQSDGSESTETTGGLAIMSRWW